METYFKNTCSGLELRAKPPMLTGIIGRQHHALKNLQRFDDVPMSVKFSKDPNAIPWAQRAFLTGCTEFAMKRFWTVGFGEAFRTIESTAMMRFVKDTLFMSQRLIEAREWVARIDAGEDSFEYGKYATTARLFFAAGFFDDQLRNILTAHVQNDGFNGDDRTNIFNAFAAKWAAESDMEIIEMLKANHLDFPYPKSDKIVHAVKEMHRRYFVYGFLHQSDHFYKRAIVEITDFVVTGPKALLLAIVSELRQIAALKYGTKAGASCCWQRGEEEEEDEEEVEDEEEEEEGEEDEDEEDEDRDAWNVQGTPFTEDRVEEEEEKKEEEEEDRDAWAVQGTPFTEEPFDAKEGEDKHVQTTELDEEEIEDEEDEEEEEDDEEEEEEEERNQHDERERQLDNQAHSINVISMLIAIVILMTIHFFLGFFLLIIFQGLFVVGEEHVEEEEEDEDDYEDEEEEEEEKEEEKTGE